MLVRPFGTMTLQCQQTAAAVLMSWLLLREARCSYRVLWLPGCSIPAELRHLSEPPRYLLGCLAPSP